MIFLITYKQKVPGKDYSSFFNAIKTADSWSHYLDSAWMIKTDETIDSWNEKLYKELVAGDYLFIVEVDPNKRNGYLPKDAWDWIKKHEK